MIINHNISAINANRLLKFNSGRVSGNMEKLASGMRINKAGDDASGPARMDHDRIYGASDPVGEDVLFSDEHRVVAGDLDTVGSGHHDRIGDERTCADVEFSIEQRDDPAGIDGIEAVVDVRHGVSVGG